MKDVGGEKFYSPASDDGTVEIAGGGFFGQVLDTDGRERTELDLFVDIVTLHNNPNVILQLKISLMKVLSLMRGIKLYDCLDRLPYPDKIKKKIREEFDEVLRLLEFEVKGHDIFRRWYVDGRIFYHKVIDSKNPRKGIAELTIH